LSQTRRRTAGAKAPQVIELPRAAIEPQIANGWNLRGEILESMI
jgi:hypothetical protein